MFKVDGREEWAIGADDTLLGGLLLRLRDWLLTLAYMYIHSDGFLMMSHNQPHPLKCFPVNFNLLCKLH